MRGPWDDGFTFHIRTVSLQAAARARGTAKAEAPPSPKVEHEGDVNVVHVDHPEQFPLATAVGHVATSQLVATGGSKS